MEQIRGPYKHLRELGLYSEASGEHEQVINLFVAQNAVTPSFPGLSQLLESYIS